MEKESTRVNAKIKHCMKSENKANETNKTICWGLWMCCFTNIVIFAIQHGLVTILSLCWESLCLEIWSHWNWLAITPIIYTIANSMGGQLGMISGTGHLTVSSSCLNTSWYEIPSELFVLVLPSVCLVWWFNSLWPIDAIWWHLGQHWLV